MAEYYLPHAESFSLHAKTPVSKDHLGEEVRLRQPEMTIEAAQILPGPDSSGAVVGRDGRMFNVGDVDVLAANLNSQNPAVRLDIDHRSEPAAYGYNEGPVPTAASGWLKNWRVEQGELMADIEINHYWTNELIRNRAYRYLSPALLIDKQTNTVVGMSSVTLCNNPNLKLTALNSAKEDLMEKPPQSQTKPESEATPTTIALQQKLDVAQTELQTVYTDALEQVLNSAISGSKITPAERDEYEGIVLNHKDGLKAGIAALQAILSKKEVRADLHALGQTITPQIQVPKSGGNDALTASEIHCCQLTGVSPEAFRQMGKEQTTDQRAVVTVTYQSRDSVLSEIRKELNLAGISSIELNATTTPALIGDLTRVFNNEFNVGFAMPSSFWKTVCMEVPSSGKGNVYGWMKDLPSMSEWTGDRTLQDLASEGYKVDNKDYELTVAVGANDLADDNVGVYLPLFRQMGFSAASQYDGLIRDILKKGHNQLCHDGQYFFDTDHPVKTSTGTATTYSNKGTVTAAKPFIVLLDLSRPYKPFVLQMRQGMNFVAMDMPTDEKVFTSKQFRYGVDCRMAAAFGLYQLAYAFQDDLTAANVTSAISKMRGQLSAAGDRPLGVNPTHIIVPPAQEFVASQLFKLPTVASGGANQMYNRLQVIDTDWLAGASIS